MAKKNDSPPKSKLGRGKVIGQVVVSVAGKKMKAEAKAAFLPSEERQKVQQQTHEEMAQIVFAGLAKLRGTALKLAQVFCANTGLLPESYLREFEKSHYRVPTLSPPLVRSVLRRELQAEPEGLFSKVEWTRAAAASLGQVHRAVLLSGEIVAVKVQYPGMQESLVADMQLARLALKPILRSGLILSALAQMESRLQEEIDYRLELANLQGFAELNLPVRIPKPYPAHCTSRVLTMEWVDGVTLDAWMDSRPSQAERDRVAQTLFDLFVEGVFARGCFHSDANLGNFFMQPSGQLALLDFGSVARLAGADVLFYAQLWSEANRNEELVRCYQERGAQCEDGFWDSCIEPYRKWIRRFLMAGEFDFAQQPEFVNEGYRLFTSQLFDSRLQEYRDELLMAHRTLLGLMALGTRLQARISTDLARSRVAALTT